MRSKLSFGLAPPGAVSVSVAPPALPFRGRNPKDGSVDACITAVEAQIDQGLGTGGGRRLRVVNLRSWPLALRAAVSCSNNVAR